ncbi:hypothetical protein BN990_04233 [Virgibacillus salexigens]|uniref:Uncharacterized protein n=1 Tax=Virgibacillus massiliensis TaxID=1462526 RepID=A0A024QH74_9BACI|nr:hypothetical protein BN990_04233 [Virgibacillus massiliensis]
MYKLTTYKDEKLLPNKRSSSYSLSNYKVYGLPSRYSFRPLRSGPDYISSSKSFYV